MTDPSPASYTTNAQDQREVAQLQARLRKKPRQGLAEKFTAVPSVVIAQGAHKYCLLHAQTPTGDEQYIVTSKQGAYYHRNAAEPMIAMLEQAGYTDIEVKGGGRILLDEEARKISIFGFSYGFGPANHAVSRQVVLEDPRYADFDVTISDEGY
jgi:phosphohistidine phosphatase